MTLLLALLLSALPQSIRETAIFLVAENMPTAAITSYTEHDDCPGRWCDGLNAMMQVPVEGRSLACPPHIPLGTRVWIETVGVRVCDDRGGKVKGARLDLYMESRERALRFGRRTLRYLVLAE